MKSVDPGILPRSCCFTMTPSETAKKLYFYLTWCGHYYCNENYFMRRNRYQYMLVMFICHGTMRIEYRGNGVDAQRGDVLLLDCTEPHYYHARDGLEFLYIHFDGSNAKDICHFIIEQRGWHITDETNVHIGKLLSDTVRLYENIGMEPAFEASKRVYRLFELFLVPMGHELLMDNPVTKTMRYVHNNIDKAITLEKLAAVANLSVYYYAHSFKRQVGISPIEYLIQTRMERAKSLLIRTSKSVSEIAYEVGYSCSGGFINQFIKRVGYSPKNYRNFHRPKYGQSLPMQRTQDTFKEK